MYVRNLCAKLCYFSKLLYSRRFGGCVVFTLGACVRKSYNGNLKTGKFILL